MKIKVKVEPPTLTIISNVKFFKRLWTFIIIPFTYIFFGKIEIK